MTVKRNIMILLLVGCAAQAQLTDSLSLNRHEVYTDFDGQLWQSPIFSTSQKLSDYTQTQLDFTHKSFGLKRVQTAETINNYGFNTNGIYNVNSRLKLFGNFSFEKTYEKDLGYNFSSERTEHQPVLSPNYFFAPKKGDWQIQNYILNAGATYRFENGILLATTLRYRNGKNYRTNDPRPELKISNYGATLHAGYTLDTHTAYLMAGMGKKSESGNITYVNDNLNAPVYTETFTRFSSGYGRMLFNSSYGNYIFQDLDKTAGFGYQYQKDRNSVQLDYTYVKTLQKFYEKDARGQIYIDDALVSYKYRVKSHRTKMNYYYDGQQSDYYASLQYNVQQGDNFSVIENGQNYRMTSDHLGFRAGVLNQEDGNVRYGLQFTADYKNLSYIDLLGYTDKALQTLELGTAIDRDLCIRRGHKLNVQLSFTYDTALDENFIYTGLSSDSSFADEVMIPDHAFDVMSKLRTGLHLNYKLKLKDKELIIFGNYDFQKGLDDAYKAYTSNFTNGTNHWLKTGIIINY